MGQHRANPVQAFIRRLWRALCQRVRPVQAAHQRASDIPRWDYLAKCQKVIDDGGRVEHRWYGPEGMEQAACFAEVTDSIDALAYCLGIDLCTCGKEKMKHQLERAEQVKINRIQKEYTQDMLPNPEQVRHDVNWLVSLALRLSERLEKVTRER